MPEGEDKQRACAGGTAQPSTPSAISAEGMLNEVQFTDKVCAVAGARP